MKDIERQIKILKLFFSGSVQKIFSIHAHFSTNFGPMSHFPFRLITELYDIHQTGKK